MINKVLKFSKLLKKKSNKEQKEHKKEKILKDSIEVVDIIEVEEEEKNYTKEDDIKLLLKYSFENSEIYKERIQKSFFLAGDAIMESCNIQTQETVISLNWRDDLENYQKTEMKPLVVSLCDTQLKEIFNGRPELPFYMGISLHNDILRVQRVAIFDEDVAYEIDDVIGNFFKYTNIKIFDNLMIVDNRAISNNRLGWYEAMDYAKNLSYGGYNDWRLPTMEELKKIYSGRFSFINIDIETWFYWSSKICPINDKEAWFLNFNTENRASYDVNIKGYTLCVRTIKE